MKLLLVFSRYVSLCVCLLFSSLSLPVTANPKLPTAEPNLVVTNDGQRLETYRGKQRSG